uniref:Uncharacterized protein n=1 Tax=Salmonella sp. TaxID=599 RepID=A0A482EU01_SALSP|nr:hypothetical protein NNIBIDOC_00230 [Salmonella sp.]
MRLRTRVFHTVYGREFDVALLEVSNYESGRLLRHVVNALSQEMANRTLTTGIRGGFAGGDAANFLALFASTALPDRTVLRSVAVCTVISAPCLARFVAYEVPQPVWWSTQHRDRLRAG